MNGVCAQTVEVSMDIRISMNIKEVTTDMNCKVQDKL